MLKNFQPLDQVCEYVYGEQAWYFDTLPVRPVHEVVQVDYKVHGCPMDKGDYMNVAKSLLMGKEPKLPKYPVCVECKMKENVCRFDEGECCLGPITRAGCGAPCPAGGLGCWGCRGPAEIPNYDEFFALAKERGFTEDEIKDRLAFFGGFEDVL